MINLKFVATIGNSSLAVTDVADSQSEAFEVIFGKCFKGDKGDAGAAPVITSTKVGKTTTIYCDGVAIATIVDGDAGAPGQGVPTGGTTGQVLKKKSGTNYDTEWGAAFPEIDESSITKNDDDELQAEGVIEQNAGNVLKKWVGTKAEYDALASHSNDTEYTITDDNTPIMYDVLVVDEMMIFGEHSGARVENETLIIG